MQFKSKYIKITTKDNIHHNFTYKEGLNTDHLPLNDKECEAGGLSFIDTTNQNKWLIYIKRNNKIGYWIWDCEPVGDFISFYGKHKAQSIILSNPRCIWMDPKFQSSAIEFYGMGIQYVIDPSEKLQLKAVSSNGKAIQWIKNPSENVKLAAVKKYGDSIQWITDPSEDVILAAVIQDGEAIQWIADPSEAVQLASIRKYGTYIKYIKYPSEAVQLEAVRRNKKAINYITNPSESVQLSALE
jgi:hypothetical protein